MLLEELQKNNKIKYPKLERIVYQQFHNEYADYSIAYLTQSNLVKIKRISKGGNETYMLLTRDIASKIAQIIIDEF